MPSTFTNNGGIELPADGEKDGVWGDVVNLNMQIVDRLTNGVGAVSLTGTTHALTTANGVLSDGQYGLIVFGGSPSGTNTVTISPNDAEKVYFVRNATAQSVIMTQGSGGNVTIPAGTGAIVYANGAGTGAAVADLTATFVPDLALAGVTATPAELNLLIGATLDLGDVTATAAELNLLIGATLDLGDVTATAAELNLLIGATLDLGDVTATAAEINLLAGVPLTTDLSYVDGVTSAIQTQIDGKQPLDADLTAVAGLATSGLVARTGAGTAAARSIAVSGLATIADGNAVAGNPTVGVPAASQAEAEAGTDNTKVMTPLRVAQAVAANVPAPTTSEVLSATAGAAFGAVGTYAFLYSGNNVSIVNGSNYAGSDLFAAGIWRDGSTIPLDDARSGPETTRGGSAQSGTWKAMGRVNVASTAGSDTRITLFLRIA
jgi:hypothetical protein